MLLFHPGNHGLLLFHPGNHWLLLFQPGGQGVFQSQLPGQGLLLFQAPGGKPWFQSHSSNTSSFHTSTPPGWHCLHPYTSTWSASVASSDSAAASGCKAGEGRLLPVQVTDSLPDKDSRLTSLNMDTIGLVTWGWTARACYVQVPLAFSWHRWHFDTRT